MNLKQFDIMLHDAEVKLKRLKSDSDKSAGRPPRKPCSQAR